MKNRLNKVSHKVALIAFAGALLLSSQVAFADSNGVDRVKVNEIHNQNAVSIEPAVKPFSLIDLSKLKWSQSYTMSFGSSSFGSAGVGMYTGSLLYEISPKLSLQFAMGMAHNLSGNAVGSKGELFPAFALDYHPSEKFRLRINVQRSPYSQSRNSNRYFSGYNPSAYNSFGGFGGYSSFGQGDDSGFDFGAF